MFYIVELQDHIRVEPELFGLPTEEAVEKQIVKTYENYFDREIGAGKIKTKYYSTSWNRDWAADQSRFEKFHWIFASTHISNPSKPAKEMYDAFMAFITAKEAGQ